MLCYVMLIIKANDLTCNKKTKKTKNEREIMTRVFKVIMEF